MTSTSDPGPEVGHGEDHHSTASGARHRVNDILRLAERGFHVFPVDPESKKPLTRWAKGGDGQRATTDPETIERWFVLDHPVAGVGIATGPSGLLVVDRDPKNGAPGWNGLEILYGELPETLSARTPSGGEHRYYRTPEGRHPRSTVGKIMRGFDTRGEGGYVKAPPSDGYRWLTDSDFVVADAPEWLLDEVEKARRPEGAPPPTDPGTIDVGELRDALAAIDNGPRDNWVSVGMALKSTGLGEARGLWDEWSEDGYAVYSTEAQEEQWDSFCGEGLRIGTIFHMAREAGWRRPRPDPREDFAEYTQRSIPIVARGRRGEVELERGANEQVLRNLGNAVRIISTMDLGLTFDVMAERMMMVGAGYERLRRMFPELPREYEDATTNALRWAIRESEHRIEFNSQTILDACLTLAHNRAVNPVADWLLRLRWDGTERVSTWTRRLLEAQGPLAAEAGRILLQGAVARVLCPGIKLDTMVVLEGEQGSGKSSAVAILGDDRTLEGLPTTDLRNKDVVHSLLGKWFVELDELDAVTNKADVGALKSFLSRTHDRARLSYAKTSKDFPRRCVIVGTTNDSSYLRDSTGNRRFLPIKTGRIDLDGLRAERDQLFAEAVASWNADPRADRLVLRRDLWGAAAEEQEKRRARDPWEEMLEEWLGEGGDGADLDIVKPGELLAEALGKPGSTVGHNDYRRVAQAMARLGWGLGRARRPRRDGGRGTDRKRTEFVRGYVRPGSRHALRLAENDRFIR